LSPKTDHRTIFFSVGEPSGDFHGANLIRELKKKDPTLEIVGYGGPEMEKAGCQLHEDLTRLAVMWLLRVILNFHKFWALKERARKYFRDSRPDAVVLIDYPGFNWWIARCARREGIPVFYYTPPQIWAWARWRVKKMRAFVDHVLCSLPFEVDWLNSRGCYVTYVGHPFFDEVDRVEVDRSFIDEQNNLDETEGPLVTLLPGSRTQEVENNLRWFIKTVAKVNKAVPRSRFAIAAFRPHQADFAKELVEKSGLPIRVYQNKTPELMRAAHCCLACSGSVSLELLHHRKPTVILYWIPRYAYIIQTWFKKVKYITLVNLLSTKNIDDSDLRPFDPSQPDADQVLFPEYLTYEDKTDQLAAHLIEWLTDSGRYIQRVEQLDSLAKEVGIPGASFRAASYIVDELNR
jgi:lipid-A-disaccharide synthase